MADQREPIRREVPVDADDYDPSLPTKEGTFMAADRDARTSGPDNVGTRPQDAPRALDTDQGGPRSATSRLWRQQAPKLRRTETEMEAPPVVNVQTGPAEAKDVPDGA